MRFLRNELELGLGTHKYGQLGTLRSRQTLVRLPTAMSGNLTRQTQTQNFKVVVNFQFFSAVSFEFHFIEETGNVILVSMSSHFSE